jgi:hypothetical protein
MKAFTDRASGGKCNHASQKVEIQKGLADVESVEAFKPIATAAMGTLPWIVVPAILVLIDLLAHVVIFANSVLRDDTRRRVVNRKAIRVPSRQRFVLANSWRKSCIVVHPVWTIVRERPQQRGSRSG